MGLFRHLFPLQLSSLLPELTLLLDTPSDRTYRLRSPQPSLPFLERIPQAQAHPEKYASSLALTDENLRSL